LDDFLRGIDHWVEGLLREQAELAAKCREQEEAFREAQKRGRDEFCRVLDDFRELIPHDLRGAWPAPESGSLSEIFAAALSALVAKTNQLQKGIEQSPAAARLAELTQQYDTMLAHLDSARHFLQTTASTQVVTSETVRSQLLAECARIGQYVEDRKRNLPLSPLFDAAQMADVNTIAEVFLGLVSDEQLEESPFRELVSLFLCVGQLNAVLVNTMEGRNTIVRQAERIANDDLDRQELIEELSGWKQK
jgi:hypothetical protein